MKTFKLYRCSICGNLFLTVNDGGAIPTCCGSPMSELTENTVDASAEKHVPVWKAEKGGVSVSVGTTEHPMSDLHFIEWICLVTKKGWQLVYLSPGQKPQARFPLAAGDCPVGVYAYCNLHGLWYAEQDRC